MMTLSQETPKGISKQSLSKKELFHLPFTWKNNSPYNEWTDFQCIDCNASISCDSYMYTNNGVQKCYDSPEESLPNCEKLSKIPGCSDSNMVPWMNMGLMPEQNPYFPPSPQKKLLINCSDCFEVTNIFRHSLNSVYLISCYPCS